MAGVGTAGTSLLEAYVMRSIYKEKLKKLERQQADAGMVAEDDKQKIPSGCFFWGAKKSHSAKVSSTIDSDRKLQADEKWDCRN